MTFSQYYLLLQSYLFVFGAILVALIRPHKNSSQNIVDIINQWSWDIFGTSGKLNQSLLQLYIEPTLSLFFFYPMNSRIYSVHCGHHCSQNASEKRENKVKESIYEKARGKY